MALSNGVTQCTVDFVGEIGVSPRLVRINTTDSISTLTAANYLAPQQAEGFVFQSSDFFAINYNGGQGWFLPTIASNGQVTLSPASNAVVIPTIASHIATYTDTKGTISEDAATAINGGNIQAGLSGTAGYLASFPATASKGSFRFQATANTGNTVSTFTNAAMGQASTITVPDPAGAAAQVVLAPAALVSGNMVQASGTAGLVSDSTIVANRVFYGSFATPDVGINLVSFHVNLTSANLAGGASVTLYPSSGSKQYRVRQLYMNATGISPFSGGGGDRTIYIGDSFGLQYSIIPAASAQAWPNATWGDTALPYSATIGICTATTSGSALIAQYAGGTTDYTAGSVFIGGILERIA